MQVQKAFCNKHWVAAVFCSFVWVLLSFICIREKKKWKCFWNVASLRTVNDNMWSCCLLFFYVVGRDFNGTSEVLQMTSGERKCWNITILDDSISEGQRTHYVGVKQFYITLRPLHASVGSASAWVYIRDNDRGICSSWISLERWFEVAFSYCTKEIKIWSSMSAVWTNPFFAHSSKPSDAGKGLVS